jgi:hypothetical protein
MFIKAWTINAGGTSTIDNISVRELPGFHATQSTAAARPIYGRHPFGGRRNLLTRTEEFNDGAWVKDRASVTLNSAAAPDGSVTADKLIEDTSNNTHLARQIVTAPLGTFTFSVYVKAAERTRASVSISDNITGLASVDVSLTDGSFASTTSGSWTGTVGSVTALPNGWYRVSVSASRGAGSVTMPQVTISNGVTTSYTGDGTSGILIWGAQLELGSTATPYQRVTTQFDVTEAGVPDVHYLFHGGASDPRWMITPTITPESALTPTGPELVTNGGFATDTDWIKEASWTISGGSANANVGSNVFSAVRQNINLVAGRLYRITYTVSSYTSGSVGLTTYGGTQVFGAARSATGTYTEIFVAATGNTGIGLQARGAGFVGSVDNISVREVTGAADKAQVFAGVRKLSDAAAGSVVELSVSSGANSGVTHIHAAPGATAGYSYRSAGTVTADANILSGYAAPITNVLTGIGDISGDASRLRVNGTQAAQNTADQGTGNFLAYPLYIGMRGGTSLPFNGHNYGLIVRFGANLDPSVIAQTERWMADKTGITI